MCVHVCVFVFVCVCVCPSCGLCGGGGGGANVSSYVKQSVSVLRSEFYTVREYRYMKMIFYY